MNKSPGKIFALSVFIAVAIAVCFWGHQRLETQRAIGAAATARRNDEIERLRTENDRLKAEQRDLLNRTAAQTALPTSTLLSSSDAAHLDALKWLGEAQARRMIGFTLYRPETNGQLRADFASLFRLKPADILELQEALDKTKRQLDEITLAHATLQPEPAEVVVLEVPPVTEGPALKEALVAAFQRILGPERYASYLAMTRGSGSGLDSFFNYYNRDAQRITLKHSQSPQANGQPRYDLYMQRSANGQFAAIIDRGTTRAGLSSGTSSSGGNVGQWALGAGISEVNRQLGPLAKLIPTDFWK